MVAFHHQSWDYYIEGIKETPERQDWDVLLLQTELESGLDKKSIGKLMTMLNENEEYIPFSTAENNTSAHGFIKVTTLESLDWMVEPIEQFVQEIIGDLDKESENGVYVMDNAIRIVIS